MFHHVKELQFNARVSKPDPRFAALLMEQFGGGNGELKAAMQYFCQSFAARQPYPDKYDMLMDIATEEFSHLEIVGATITMLMDGVNGELKDAAHDNEVVQLSQGALDKDTLIHQALTNPEFLTLTGGGVHLTNAAGVPWTGAYVNSNGDLTVDLRSDIAAESRAKIVYEYLMQLTDDPLVRDTLRFLMTREVAHFQMFSAALDTIQPNFPPGILQADPAFSHTVYNMSDGASARGPWNEGKGPWQDGGKWEYIEDPVRQTLETKGQLQKASNGGGMTPQEARTMEQSLSESRSSEVKGATPKGPNQWSSYPQDTLASPMEATMK